VDFGGCGIIEVVEHSQLLFELVGAEEGLVDLPDVGERRAGGR